MIVAAVATAAGHTRFQVLYEWSYFNFTWQSEEQLQAAITKGQYVPENIVLSGLKYYEGRFYFTLPRMKNGVPATLASIPANAHNNDTEPLLEPYPSWSMNKEGDCSALQNVQNVEIDPSGRIWILDGGRTGTMTQVPNTECPPRLLIYYVTTRTTVANYVFPDEITAKGCFLYDIVVDDIDGGHAYITDNSGTDPGIIVYSLRKNRAWKHRDDSSMRAAEDAIHFRVNGTALSAPINIAGIALGPQIRQYGNDEYVLQERTVYFCALSSLTLYSVKNTDLLEEHGNISSKIRMLGRKAAQTDGMVMDENGVLYYGLLSDNSIAKWDSKMPFTSAQRIIARDPIYIQWPDSLAFDTSGNLLVVTNKLQKFIYGQINLNEPNFRILSANLGVKSYLYGEPEVSVRESVPRLPTTVQYEEPVTFARASSLGSVLSLVFVCAFL